MKKILIYGIGNNAAKIEKEIDSTKYNIIAYTDGISDLSLFNGKRFIKRDKISELQFDFIVITISNEIIRYQAINYLKNEKIPQEKIVDYYNYVKVDRVMRTCHGIYEGIILGMSHAEVGLLPDRFPFRCCNLAISSQDIFMNFKTLEHCYTYYRDKIYLNYLIIDMYDYRWFNIDLSMSGNMYPYIRYWHGFRGDKHHLEENKNINYLQKEELRKILKNYCCTSEIFDCIEFNGGIEEESRKVHIEKKKYELHDLASGIWRDTRRDKTIAENIKYFENIMQLARKFNPKVRIILLLLPRYIQMEYLVERYHRSWKIEFMLYIAKLQKQYGVEFYNYREDKTFTENHELFFDLEHLNWEGGVAFSSNIAKDIF